MAASSQLPDGDGSTATQTRRHQWTESLKRRGLIAGVAALVLGAVAKQSAPPAEATSGTGTDGNLVMGSNGLNHSNTAAQVTVLVPASGSFTGSEILAVQASAGSTTTTDLNAILGTGKGAGAGVYGQAGPVPSTSFPNSGVYGEGAAGSTGVYGTSSGGTGVYGQSNNHIGVWGVTTTSGQGLANPAVAGSNDGGGAGLVGFTTGPSSIGLGGATDVGIGAYGSSQTGIGLFGYSNTGFAINGNSPGGGYAGYFSGPVFVTGSLTAMGAKSAAVRTKGGLNRVYSMESPESWFEDFGSGQLTGGQATVSLEFGFAGIVHTDTYHVFLTASGDSQGLYVSERHSSGFTVREQQNGKSNVAFDYRVVAKRADIEGARLEHVDEPHPPDGPKEPVLDHAPKPPSNQAPTPKNGR
jgi:hypothetical protein